MPENRKGRKMTKRTLVLAALASSDKHSYTPVQIQKLIFLIDRKVSNLISASRFKFVPYHYGPFDRQVYLELDKLEEEGFVQISEASRMRTYTLTSAGCEKARSILEEVPEPSQSFIRRASEFVRTNPFPKLVAAIYKAYPEMRKNSVFQN